MWHVGVYDVVVDGEDVTLKGKDLDVKTLCQELKKRSGKHVELSGATPKMLLEGEKGDGDQKKDVKEDDSSNKKDENKN